ncbi:MAG: chromosomal replication initiator protein DnaA [Pseudomonadota bacterium]|nr:chromosomal replication initiator protein DnaA [Pseudomonadota bacterium]
MGSSKWSKVLSWLQHDIESSCFNMYICPLQVKQTDSRLFLLAPNNFVKNEVNNNYLDLIQKGFDKLFPEDGFHCSVILGSIADESSNKKNKPSASDIPQVGEVSLADTDPVLDACLNPDYTFENFVSGSSNEIARAAAIMAGEKPGSYNPLLIYGVSGLGKSHLLHSAGHAIVANKPGAKVKYLSSERFVSEMVTALQKNQIEQFKDKFRSLDALLLDDIQFFAKKVRSQEELFHTINSLLDGNQQIIITSDCHPKEQEGIEERLRSRFCWGLAVGIEPPELETRVAILIKKAASVSVDLSQDVAFFIAENIKSNVRELEGALKKVIANSHFMGESITLPFAKNALKDLLNVHAKFITLENIQKGVSQYYNIKHSDILSNTRRRSIARPRQMAMALSKHLTTKSLPEIGSSFGGRDHTTVLHACRKISELVGNDLSIKEDWDNLLRLLTV